VNPDELRAFLERREPALVGVVGTLREDGSPHLVPVWYRWDGESILIWTDDVRVWARNLRRDPRVAFSVQEIEAPFAAVALRGRATLTRADDDETLGQIRRIIERYVPGNELPGFLESWLVGPQILVRIEPEVVRSWSAAI
jgi:PPOX class probable F420-dependent enzyme